MLFFPWKKGQPCLYGYPSLNLWVTKYCDYVKTVTRVNGGGTSQLWFPFSCTVASKYFDVFDSRQLCLLHVNWNSSYPSIYNLHKYSVFVSLILTPLFYSVTLHPSRQASTRFFFSANCIITSQIKWEIFNINSNALSICFTAEQQLAL